MNDRQTRSGSPYNSYHRVHKPFYNWMMVANFSQTHMTQTHISPEQYLEWEKTSPTKHEYINGRVYAMAGANDAHNTLTFNLSGLFYTHLQGRSCRGYAADMKVKIASEDIYYYPDLLVTCDERDRENRDFKQHPKLIIEVLSESTEKFDRSQKFADYRTLDPLQEYVLVSQDQINIELFRRNNAGRWELYVFRESDDVEFASLELCIPMATVYENVIFETP
ncbi:MAG: Uma2 family endonuclease [Geitlerinemataceae cyanobacterium]